MGHKLNPFESQNDCPQHHFLQSAQIATPHSAYSAMARFEHGRAFVGIAEYMLDLAVVGSHSKQVHAKMPQTRLSRGAFSLGSPPEQPISHDLRRSYRLAGCLTPAPVADPDR